MPLCSAFGVLEERGVRGRVISLPYHSHTSYLLEKHDPRISTGDFLRATYKIMRTSEFDI